MLCGGIRRHDRSYISCETLFQGEKASGGKRIIDFGISAPECTLGVVVTTYRQGSARRRSLFLRPIFRATRIAHLCYLKRREYFLPLKESNIAGTFPEAN